MTEEEVLKVTTQNIMKTFFKNLDRDCNWLKKTFSRNDYEMAKFSVSAIQKVLEDIVPKLDKLQNIEIGE